MTAVLQPITQAIGLTLYNIPAKRQGKANGTALLPFTADFTLNSSYQTKIALGHGSLNRWNIADLQSLYVDNSNNAQATTFVFLNNAALQTINCPPLSQGYYPLQFDGGNLEFVVSSSGAAKVQFNFLNVIMPYNVWNAALPSGGSIVVSGTVSVNEVVGVKTDRGAALVAGGTSQVLMAANGARKGFIIRNPGTIASQGIVAPEPAVINLNAAAVLNAITGYELLPGESISTTEIGVNDQEAINWVAASTGHILQAWEF